MTDESEHQEPRSERERHALKTALWLNAGLAAGLLAAGVMSDSSGLIANALDNASDAGVYAMSYHAVARGPRWKTRAAKISGVALLVLSAVVLADVVRRLVSGAEPGSTVIIVMSVVAAVVNVACLKLLHSSRRDDVNLRAAWTFSINDLLSNLGVLISGILVAWLGRSWPDLVIGIAIALLCAKGGFEILADARRTQQSRHS